MVIAQHPEREPARVLGTRRRVLARMHRDREKSVEARQRGTQLIDTIVRDGDLDDPRERAGEFGELTVLPVAAVRVDDIGDRGDQSRPVGSDHRQHKRSHVPQRTDRRRRIQGFSGKGPYHVRRGAPSGTGRATCLRRSRL